MVWKKTIWSQIFEQLADERRVVIAAWRIHILYRKYALKIGNALPDNKNIRQLISTLVRKGDLLPVIGAKSVYQINSPFAKLIPFSPEHALQEVNPWSAFNGLWALAHHGLTDIIPRALYAADYGHIPADRLPLGTTPDDWAEIRKPNGTCPNKIRETNVIWSKHISRFDFGHAISYQDSLPIYVTDIERSLLEALDSPEKNGGISTALGAWHRALGELSIEKLMLYTERFESPVLRQRVGFILESLSLSHPKLDEWAKHAQRGGSMRLLASAPHASTFSERWCLSLNVPDTALTKLREG